MHNANAERTFEHNGHVIHVHAFRGITADTWTIQVAVVGNGTQNGAWAQHVAWNEDLFCNDPEDALDTGAQMAVAYVADIAAHSA